jgi:hypothetical protein
MSLYNTNNTDNIGNNKNNSDNNNNNKRDNNSDNKRDIYDIKKQSMFDVQGNKINKPLSNIKNEDELNNLRELNKKYQQLLSDYSQEHKFLMSQTNDYISNNNTNSNTDFNTNIIVRNNYTNPKENKIGCYNKDPNNGLLLQNDIGPESLLENCKLRAFDTNNKVFAINGSLTDGKCYIGNDIEKAKSGGISYNYTTTTSWKSPSNPSITSPPARAILLPTGQIRIVTNENKIIWVSQTWEKIDIACHSDFGGTINYNTTSASWGLGCSDTKSGNWTDCVRDFTNGKYNIAYSVNTNANSRFTPCKQNPSPDCKKSFSATYQCGNGPFKGINIAGESQGQSALFDCSVEYPKCINRLVMQDDGNLVVYTSTNKVLWASNTQYKTGIADITKSAVKGKNRMNYISSVDTLYMNEFIGSPSGNCYVIMTPTGLEIRYSSSVATCDVDKGMNIYTIPLETSGQQNLGKIGYVDDIGTLKEYPTNMITKSNKYIEIGNFDSNGNDISNIKAKSPEECMTGCNKIDECDGFVHLSGTCYLKNSNMYPKSSRIYRENSKLYKRIPLINNNNSCNKTLIDVSLNKWGKYKIDNTPMTLNTLCGLGKLNNSQQEKINAIETQLTSMSNEMLNAISNLTIENKNLLDAYGLNETLIKKNVATFASIKKTHATYTNKIPTLTGMKDESLLELTSYNYSYIVWSILIAILVILSIKFLR